MPSRLNMEDFTDIKDLKVDKSKPKAQRIKEFISDVKNPYTVRVGDIMVRIEFAGVKSLSDALSVALPI